MQTSSCKIASIKARDTTKKNIVSRMGQFWDFGLFCFFQTSENIAFEINILGVYFITLAPGFTDKA